MNKKYDLIYFIYNPLSSSFTKTKVRNFEIFLKSTYGEINTICLNADDDLNNILNGIAFFSNKILFIFASGDGTINKAINFILTNNLNTNNIFISVCPFGTANILSMELGTDTIGKCKKSLIKNNIKKVHCAKITDLKNDNYRYFTLMASIGFDSRAINKTKLWEKKIFGKFAYIYHYLFNMFFGKKDKFEIIVDKAVYIGSFVCVSNGKYYGIKKKFTNSDLIDNSMEIVIAKKNNFFSFFKFFMFKKSKNIIYKKVNSVFLNDILYKDNKFQIDGDCFFFCPCTINNTNIYINFIYY